MKKRRAFKVVVFLLLISGGAIVNVAVAWGCALRVHDRLGESKGHVSDIVPFLDEEGAGRVRAWACFAGSESIVSIAQCLGACRFQCDTCSGRSCVNTVVCSGLPYDTLFGSKFVVSRRLEHRTALLELTRLGNPDLPLRPIWPGFAINTIFYAAILWLLFFTPGFVRRRIRIKRGQCPACAYPIRTSPVCTECGKPVALP